jgi:hypothetical protein
VISEEERKKRELLQAEADKEKAKIKPQQIRVDGIEIDLQDRKTRLIDKTSIPPGEWDSGKTSIPRPMWNRAPNNSRPLPKEQGCELFWRIPRLYFILLVDLEGEVKSSKRIELIDAHNRMELPYQKFITDAQKTEFQVEDLRLQDCQKEQAEWPVGEQEKSVLADPETRLIGYDRSIIPADNPSIVPRRLYYNLRDGNYFLHEKTGRFTLLSAEEGRHRMDHEGFNQCVTEDEKKEIRQTDGLAIHHYF